MPTPFGEELGEPSAKGTKDLRGKPLFLSGNEYRVTAKPGKLYFTFFIEPRVPFELPAMSNAVKRAYLLANGAPLELAVKDGRTSFTLPRPILDPMGDGRRRRVRRGEGRALGPPDDTGPTRTRADENPALRGRTSLDCAARLESARPYPAGS